MDKNYPVVEASFSKVHDLSMAVLDTLQDIPIGYSLLACSLTISRLLNPGKKLSDEVESKFVQDIMEWVGSYYPDSGVMN